MLGADSTPSASGAAGRAAKEEAVEVGRKTHLKFPPLGSGLRIPRVLFLCSASEEVEGKVTKGKAARGKRKKKGSEVVQQTDTLVGLMRRSIVTYEYKDRVVWDGDLDPHAESEERVRMEEVGGEREDGREGSVVEEWIADLD